METSNKLFGLIDYDRLAILMLFILFGLIIYKRMCRAKENFVSIDKDDLGKMLEDIDKLDFKQLQDFEKKVAKKEFNDNENSKRFNDLLSANENSQDFLPVDLDQSFDDLIDEEDDDDIYDEEDNEFENEDELNFGFLKNEYKTGQILNNKDRKGLKGIIEDETNDNISDSLVGKTEEILAEDEAYSAIGEKKVINQTESQFLNKLLSVKDGINKIQNGARKVKDSSLVKSGNDEHEKRFKKNNVGIFDKPSLTKLIDKSDKLFKYDLNSDNDLPGAVDEEAYEYEEVGDNEVEIRDSNKFAKAPKKGDPIERPKYEQEKDKLIIEDEGIFDETRYHSIVDLDGSNDLSEIKYLDAEKTESDIIEEPSDIDSDIKTSISEGDELTNNYDKDFKNPVNMTPIDDIQYDKRIVGSDELDDSCVGPKCSFNPMVKHKTKIDDRELRARLKQNVKSGTYIQPNYLDDINYTQMKLDKAKYDLDNQNLNSLRLTKKFNAPTEIKKLYDSGISKPNIHKAAYQHNNLIQNGLDLNKVSSNYYTFDPNAMPKNNSKSKVKGIESGFGDYSKY